MTRPSDPYTVITGPPPSPIFADDDFLLLDQSPPSPFRTLDWRWAVASYLARSGSRFRPRWIDAPVRRAIRHLRPDASPPDKPLLGALALRADPAPATRTAVEALLLAGLDDADVAARAGLEPEVVEVYHDLWYDVRPILGHSDAVIIRAFGPDLYAPTPDRDLALKHLSFFGGPFVAADLVAAVLLPEAAGDPARRDEVAGLFEEYLLAWSIPAEARSIPALERLLDRALRIAAPRDARTVESVTGPVRFAEFAADPVRADGPDQPVLVAAGREVDTLGGVACPPGAGEAEGPDGPPVGLSRLAMAV